MNISKKLALYSSPIEIPSSVQHGVLTYHELTLRERLPELNRLGKREIVFEKRGLFPQEDGILLETLRMKDEFATGKQDETTIKYFLLDTKEIIKTVERKNPEGKIKSWGGEEFTGYKSNRSSFINIPPFTYRLEILPAALLNKEDYIKGMKKGAEKIKTRQDDYDPEVYAKMGAHALGFGSAASECGDDKTAEEAYKIAEEFSALV